MLSGQERRLREQQVERANTELAQLQAKYRKAQESHRAAQEKARQAREKAQALERQHHAAETTLRSWFKDPTVQEKDTMKGLMGESETLLQALRVQKQEEDKWHREAQVAEQKLRALEQQGVERTVEWFDRVRQKDVATTVLGSTRDKDVVELMVKLDDLHNRLDDFKRTQEALKGKLDRMEDKMQQANQVEEVERLTSRLEALNQRAEAQIAEKKDMTQSLAELEKEYDECLRVRDALCGEENEGSTACAIQLHVCRAIRERLSSALVPRSASHE